MIEVIVEVRAYSAGIPSVVLHRRHDLFKQLEKEEGWSEQELGRLDATLDEVGEFVLFQGFENTRAFYARTVPTRSRPSGAKRSPSRS